MARRTPEQLIADLEKQITSIKQRAERQKVQKSPPLRFMRAALASVDKALAVSDDATTRTSLGEVRTTLSACLSLSGVLIPQRASAPQGRRGRADVAEVSRQLLDYVAKHPGQRGEQIAAQLGTDTTTMRFPMKRLIEEGKVKPKGQRRGMAYFGAQHEPKRPTAIADIRALFLN